MMPPVAFAIIKAVIILAIVVGFGRLAATQLNNASKTHDPPRHEHLA